MRRSAVAGLSPAERLRRQSEALDARADALAREASDLRREAMEMRIDAERHARAPLRVVNNTDVAREEHDTVVMDRVCAVVEAAGAVSSRYVAEHLDLPPARARAALARLVEVGAVVRTGVARGTRYALPVEDEPIPAGEPGEFRANFLSSTHPTKAELRDREIVHTTAEPA